MSARVPPALVERLLQQVYGDRAAEDVPREVLVPSLPTDAGTMASWLSERRGSAVDLRVPRRGDKRALMENRSPYAEQALARHKVARAGDLTARSQARRSFRMRWAWTRRRCASSASTSATSKAPRWSPRWSSSRTGCRARATTGGSSFGGRRRDRTGRHRRDAGGPRPKVRPA